MVTPVILRNAQEADVSEIRAIAKAAYEGYVERIGRKPSPMLADYKAHVLDGQVVVALLGGRVKGYVVYFPKNGAMFIENIAVAPDAQNAGLGHKMLMHVYAAAGANNLTTVELYTHEKMTENLAYYARQGFLEIARREEDGYSRVYFRMDLGS